MTVTSVVKDADARTMTADADGKPRPDTPTGVIRVALSELAGGGTQMDITTGISVAFDTAVDDDLRREGRVLELVHKLNAMRKDAGLELHRPHRRDAAGWPCGSYGRARSDRERGPGARGSG